MRALDVYDDIKPEYQPHLGVEAWPPFHWFKEPRWRFNGVEYIALADRKEMENGVREIVATLPKDWVIKDIYWMGSYVTGWASIGSDFDFAIVFEDHEKVKSEWSYFDKETSQWVYYPKVGVSFGLKRNEVACRLGAKIQIAPWWGNDVYFSFNQQVFVGKKWGERMYLNGKPLSFRSDDEGGFIAVEKKPRILETEPGADAYG